MTLHLDHVVIYVADLNRAMADYTALGFTVTRGGAHARTENALISFADGTYLELLALKPGKTRPIIRMAARLGLIERSAEKKTDMYWRLLRWISSGSGIVDWCAGTDDIAATLESWERAGLDHLGHQAFDRTRPDGKIAKWYLGSAKTMDLPFLIEDISPREVRVPRADMDTHPNGATGIAGLTLSVDDPDTMKALYAQLGLSALPVSFVTRDKRDWNMALKITNSGTQEYDLGRNKTNGALITMVTESNG